MDLNGNLVDVPKKLNIADKLEGKYSNFDFIEKFNTQEGRWEIFNPTENHYYFDDGEFRFGYKVSKVWKNGIMISHGCIESTLIYILNKYVTVYIGICMLLIAHFIKQPLFEIDNSYVYLLSIIP